MTIDEADGLDREAFVAAFGGVFEHSPWVAEAAWEARPHGSVAGLHAAMVAAVDAAPADRRLALIRAHPELAGRAAIAGVLTAESTREQSAAGLDRLTPGQHARLLGRRRPIASASASRSSSAPASTRPHRSSPPPRRARPR